MCNLQLTEMTTQNTQLSNEKVWLCIIVEGETCITLRKADIRIREIWKTRSCLQAASYEGIRMYTNELKTFLRLDALETL